VAKFGVYDDDLEVFTWVRAGRGSGEGPAGTGSRRRCLEAQVMDLADDVAYSVHDVEDGIVAGRIELGALRDPGLRHDVWETVQDWYLPGVAADELEDALRRIEEGTGWPRSAYDGSRSALAALKNLTSSLIGRFCADATAATREAFGGEPLIRYAADLVVPRETALEIAVLKGVAAHLVMRAEDRRGLLDQQREVIAELVSALGEQAPDSLDATFRADYLAAADDAGRLRVLVDQVASLTDASALTWHARLRR
jgi:dGTPase